MTQTRRALLASVLALAATPALAAADKKTVEVGKAFGYLENYWKLSAGERSRFVPAYYLMRDRKPAAGLKGFIVQGAVRTPISVSARGRVSPLPTLAQIKAKAQLELDVPASTKFSMTMAIEPSMRPAVEVSAPELALTITQAAKGAKKVAGLAGLAMPTLDRIVFQGVTAGTAVHADGNTTALPLMGGKPYFAPEKLKTAKTLRFTKAPYQMVVGAPD